MCELRAERLLPFEPVLLVLLALELLELLLLELLLPLLVFVELAFGPLWLPAAWLWAPTRLAICWAAWLLCAPTAARPTLSGCGPALVAPPPLWFWPDWPAFFLLLVDSFRLRV